MILHAQTRYALYTIAPNGTALAVVLLPVGTQLGALDPAGRYWWSLYNPDNTLMRLDTTNATSPVTYALPPVLAGATGPPLKCQKIMIF